MALLQCSQLLKQEEEMKIELAELNRSLLARLAQSKGDILGDSALIASLDSTKSTASRIATSLASAATLQVCQHKTFAGSPSAAADILPGWRMINLNQGRSSAGHPRRAAGSLQACSRDCRHPVPCA